MRVPLSWLREYVSFDMPPRALAEELTMRGMEVSAIEVAGAEWTDVVVGRLLEVIRHPNADTLWLTKVDVGTPVVSSTSCVVPRIWRWGSWCRPRWLVPSCPATGGSSAAGSAA